MLLLPGLDSKTILAKTLLSLNADSLEKEKQKNAQLMIRNVRDKLTSRRQNEDSIFQDLDRCYRNKRNSDQALFDKRNAIENEIAALDQNLDELQRDEYRRHSKMINQRSLELATTSMSSALNATINQQSSELTAFSSLSDTSPILRSDSKNDSLSADSVDNHVVTMQHQVNTNSGCIECNATSNHLCHKCKKCVCLLCCGEKRALENAWCWDTCFIGEHQQWVH